MTLRTKIKYFKLYFSHADILIFYIVTYDNLYYTANKPFANYMAH